MNLRPGSKDSPRSILRWIGEHPLAVLPIWISIYFAVLWRPAHRPFWYDELFAYYISAAPTWKHFIGSIVHADLNPPLAYLIFRGSFPLFGDSPFAARIPSMLAFLAASLIASRLIARRLGGGFGLAALGIFWSFSFTSYAVELRAYALLLAFFAVATLSWLNAIQSSRWTLWHAGLALSIAAMFLTHCFSLPYAAAIGVGEIVRSWRERRVDKKVWFALLIPLCVLPIYMPLLQYAHKIVFPYAYQAGAYTLPLFYLALPIPLSPVLLFLGMIWFSERGKGSLTPWAELASAHEIAFLLAALAAPICIILYCIATGVPFWDRYGVGVVLPATLILTLLLARITRRNPQSGVLVAILVLLLFCRVKGTTGTLMDDYENISTSYRDVRADLPLVSASGITFLEMDRREPPEIVHRLFYLTDPNASRRFHSTIFEGYSSLKQWFPIRANVTPYADFASQHPQFLVLTTPGFAYDWLLPKLRSDGANIQLLQESKTGYRDHSLYQVTLAPAEGHRASIQ